jgi:hypothetical protein
MMFADFDKAFKRNNQKISIPSEVVTSLSENLPKDFKYIDIGEGACAILADSSEMNMSLSIEIPQDYKPKSMSELIEFMYRAQRELRIVPDKDGYITINGSKFLLNELIKFPLGGDLVESVLYITPEPFQPPFKVTLEGGGVAKDVFIQRQPYPHMDKSSFKSTEDSIVDISYVLDEVNKNIKFTFGINIEKSHSAREIIDNIKLYQACITGRAVFAGMDFSNYVSSNADEELSKTIDFWGKIDILEQILKIRFYLDFPITDDDALWVEKLYKSFFENKAYKQYGKVDKITTVVTDGLDIDSIIKPEGLMFGLIQRSELNIWGVTLELFDVVAMFDFKVTAVILLDDEKKEYELIIESVEGKNMYTSIRHFLNKTDADVFLRKHQELQNAELLVEF